MKEQKTEYDRLFNCLVEGNQKWAHRAPVLLFSIAKLQFEDGSPRIATHSTIRVWRRRISCCSARRWGWSPIR